MTSVPRSSVAIVIPIADASYVSAVLFSTRGAAVRWIECGDGPPPTHLATHLYVRDVDADLLTGETVPPPGDMADALAKLITSRTPGFNPGGILTQHLSDLGLSILEG